MPRSLQTAFFPLGALLTAFFLIPWNAAGDEVYLKNGSILRGAASDDHTGTITLRNGSILTEIDTGEVDSIVRMTHKWPTGFSQPIHSPALQNLMDRFREVRALRIDAINRQRTLEGLDATIDSLEDAYALKSHEYQGISTDLETLEKRGPNEQYRLISRAHRYNALILGMRQQVGQKKKDLEHGNPLLIAYQDSLDDLSAAVEAFRKSGRRKLTKGDRSVLRRIENDIGQCRAEFATASADATFTSGGHIVLKVLLDGRGPVSLILDTGASTVTISQAAARRLGIGWQDGNSVAVTLANGKAVTGHSILLRSVEAGGFRTDKVRATVLKDPPGPDIDGLLGMSYLRRFMVHLDAANRKVLLKKMTVR